MAWRVILRAPGGKPSIPGGAANNFALDADDNLWFLSPSMRGIPYASRFQGQEPPPTGNWKSEPVEWKDAYLDPANWRLLVLGGRVTPEGSAKDADGNMWSWSCDGASLTIYYNGQLTHRVSILYYGYDVAVIQTGMWIGVQDELFYSDGQSLKPYRLTAGKATMNHPRVDSLAFTADGNGWATTSEGSFHFSAEVGKWEEITETRMTIPLEEGEINLIASDQQNSLWAFDWEYLARLDGQSWQRWPIPDNIFWLRTHESSVTEYQGDLWFTDTNRDLWRFDGQTWSAIDAPEITNLTQEHTGRLFAADRSGTILVYDGIDWQPLPDCAECGERYEFSEIAVDATGNVWGTSESGIWRYSTNEGWRQILKFDTYTLVESPVTDAHGDFWFRSGGVVHCDLKNCELWDFRSERWKGPITAMTADAQGRIWVGGYGLLSVYDPAAEQ